MTTKIKKIKPKKIPKMLQADGDNRTLASRSEKKYKIQNRFYKIKPREITKSNESPFSFDNFISIPLKLEYLTSSVIEVSTDTTPLISLKKISADLYQIQKELSYPLKLQKSLKTKSEEPKEIIRYVRYNPVEANNGKKDFIKSPISIMLSEIQKIVDQILYLPKIPKFLPESIIDNINLPPRLIQIAAKKASEIARSIKNKVDKANQAKKKKYQLEILDKYNKKEIKINIKDINLELDKRFILIRPNKGNHLGKDTKINGRRVDYWIKIASWPTTEFEIPLFITNHMKNLLNRGFYMETEGGRINSDGSIGIFFKKVEVLTKEPISVNNSLGVDLGRDSLVACSDDQKETTHKTGKKIKEILDIIATKRRGSKNQKRAIKFLRNEINYSLKRDIKWDKNTHLIIENLKDMKRNKKWGKKSGYWPVGYIRAQIFNLSSEHGVTVSEVSAAFTSQDCICGHRHKQNRSGEHFECRKCGYQADANIHASKNIRNRGVYSPSIRKRVPCSPLSGSIPITTSMTSPSLILPATLSSLKLGEFQDLRLCMK